MKALFSVVSLIVCVVHADVGGRAGPLAKDAASTRSAETGRDAPEIFRRISTLAKDLRSPDGIALDEKTGEVYVTEENAATICRIKPDGARQILFDGNTPLIEEHGSTRKPVAGLRSPEGLALDGKGTLYVVEDIPGGRLIAFDIRGKSANPRASGTVIPIPIANSRFAWESIDVGPSGELLIAGSTMEAFLSESKQEGLFRGAILYRDAQGEWWMPMNHAMASYSAACFAPGGDLAFYACEITGEVGCLDLQSHNLRTFSTHKNFRSPEGLCVLPGGSALVAEESGKIYRLDPTVDTVQLVYDNKSTIESVLWDASHRRVLVTDDQNGILLSLELKPGYDFRATLGRSQDIRFEEQSTPVEMIPDRCPAYLSKVLKLGGYDPSQEGGNIAFRDFAKRYSLVAIDAETTLLSQDSLVADPIKRIQFVIVAPYLIGFQKGEFIWSSSGFAAVKESGEILKTQLVHRQTIHGDLMESRFTPIGGQTIALPMPFSARINTDGTASVNFVGMGVVPDFFLVLNTVEPDRSFMVVMNPDGSMQQYEVRLPSRRNANHWVIALERNEPDVWRNLSPQK